MCGSACFATGCSVATLVHPFPAKPGETNMVELTQKFKNRVKSPNIRLICWVLALSVLTGLAAVVEQNNPFTEHDKAFYLDAQNVAFVRPGLQLKILAASIDPSGVIQVRFKITDPKGLPLDRAGVVTPGAVSTSFIAAVLPNGSTQYTAYTTRVQTSPITKQSATQAGTDTGGAYEQVGDGEYVYTFGTRAPQSIDHTATHTIGAYASRNLTEFDLGTQFSDTVFSFVPDGSPVKNARDVIRTENCNRCHDPLSAHGGARQKVELCVLCHTPQTTDPDTGNSVNFPVMVHKIHMGADLPSVKAGKAYQIIGFQQTVADFSTVEFPANARRCEVCHEPRPGGSKDAVAAQKNNYLKPNRAACGACHDNVNFATGENHVDLPQVSDNLCSTCHVPEGELDYDASIKGAHMVATHSKSLPGVVFEILKVENGKPGQNPTVTFSVKDRSSNPILPSEMTRLALVTSLGATYDYPSFVSEDATKATGSGGVYTYTFQKAIPAEAQGTLAVGIEGYRNTKLLEGTKKEMTVRDAGINKIFYYAVTDAAPVPRRAVVSQAKCDSCHASLELHGSNRNQVEQCVICHNANGTDVDRRPAAQGPPESIHFKTMIHKIHSGEDLKTDFTVYGRGGPVNFNEVRFPGDRRNCSKCHDNNSEQLPLREGLLPSQAPRGWFTPQQPITAACLSCHTGRPAASHALSNTSPLGEACETCHGPSADFAINRVHAR